MIGRMSPWLSIVGLFLTSLLAADERPGEAARRRIVQEIDALFQQAWKDAGVQPAPPADDAEFLRRLYLDLAGVVPRVAEVRKFLQDDRPEKRQELIDRLLHSPLCANHLAHVWRAWLLPPETDPQQLLLAEGLHQWLREKFLENYRFDRLVADFLTASGPTSQGPALYYAALELKPERLAASTAQVFLGFRIQCAQCHDHPFDRWTQRDFWSYAAFFARLQRGGALGTMGADRVVEGTTGEVFIPGSDQIALPRYPGSDQVVPVQRGTRRMKLAVWMASPDNPYLARNAVNRFWAILMGRGLVEPLDDWGPHNPPSHPQVLELLTRHFVQSGYNVRELLAVIARTQVYQLSSRYHGPPPPSETFAVMAIKPMSGDQLYDSLRRILADRNPEMDRVVLDGDRVEFLARMESPDRPFTEYRQGIPQALVFLQGALGVGGGSWSDAPLLDALQAPWFDPYEQTDILFLATLNRLPVPEERRIFAQELAQTSSGQERRQALADALWALLNSAEFSMNH